MMCCTSWNIYISKSAEKVALFPTVFSDLKISTEPCFLNLQRLESHRNSGFSDSGLWCDSDYAFCKRAVNRNFLFLCFPFPRNYSEPYFSSPWAVLCLSNALTWYIGQSRQVASLRDAYFERIFWLSFSMSDKATELVDTSNWAGLEIHFSILKSNPEVVYLFLRGIDDEILYAYDEDVVEEYDPRSLSG